MGSLIGAAVEERMARLDALFTAHLAQEELFVMPLLDERGVRHDQQPGG
ncbi:MAG TPA: hypothetical protein VMQ65_11495 [Candidatus Limnocylindria bacterium]|nr:hypothetical protein [Candidatus Limnocylindria bacterium]